MCNREQEKVGVGAILEALTVWQRANEALERAAARSENEGYRHSFGLPYDDETMAEREARAECARVIEAYIDQRVREQLPSMMSGVLRSFLE